MRPLARLLAVLGAVGIGLFLFRAAPRDVELVYDVSRVRGATGVEIQLRRGAELVRHTELAVPAGATQVQSRARLLEGVYDLEFRVETPAGAVSGRRPLEIREGGTIVLPLGP